MPGRTADPKHGGPRYRAERILDFSQQPASLWVRNDLLVVRLVAPAFRPVQDHGMPENAGLKPGATQEQTIPLEEIAVIVAAHPQVTFTLAVVAGLARHGGLLVTC
ncbi:MAG TPA: hypothetical protein VGW33_04505, partial [Terriglobia bacterium]|nr:hypothetical protein [Terriglobia bacterium]